MATSLKQIKTLKGSSNSISEHWKYLPLNFEYVQRKGQSAPSTLFGGGTWSNVSSEYAGLFERIEGGSSPNQSSSFGGVDQSDAMQGHGHQMYVSLGGGSASYLYETSGRSVPSAGTSVNSYVKSPISDGTNGTPRTAAETRPINTTVRVWRLTAY